MQSCYRQRHYKKLQQLSVRHDPEPSHITIKINDDANIDQLEHIFLSFHIDNALLSQDRLHIFPRID